MQSLPLVSSLQTRGNAKDKIEYGASNNNYHNHVPKVFCQELEMLNYYLDGLYLVKKNNKQANQEVRMI